MNPSAVRTGAVVAGLTYVALGVVSLTGTVPDEHWGARGDVVNLLGLLGFAATILAVEGLPETLGLGRLGRLAVRTAQLGLLAMVVESVASQLHGGNTLGAVFFLGLVLAVLSFLVVAIDGLRGGRARWLAALPFLGLVVGIIGGEHGGFIVLGVVWLALSGAVAAGSSDVAERRVAA